MGGHQRLGDRQAQPQPAEPVRVGTLPLLKGVEDARQHVRLDPDARVPDFHHDTAGMGRRGG